MQSPKCGIIVSTMKQLWRLILDAPETGHESMFLDEALAVRVAEGHSPPAIRIYAWPCIALSLGRLQKTAPLLDERRCEAEGIEIVRRPTGGTAIRHNVGDVTYSVIAPEGEPPLSRDVLESYAIVNRALVTGLESLGLRAGTRNPAPIWPETGINFGCFESPGLHEIYWAGRKIAAGAQRRTAGVILQQGTIPLSETGANIAELLSLEPGQRERLRRDLTDRTGALARALDTIPTIEDISAALANGFRRSWDIELQQSPIAPEEEDLVRRLAESE